MEFLWLVLRTPLLLQIFCSLLNRGLIVINLGLERGSLLSLHSLLTLFELLLEVVSDVLLLLDFFSLTLDPK